MFVKKNYQHGTRFKKVIVQKTEQNEIARATKSNPKKFWAYVKNKTILKSSVGDLKTIIDNGIEVTITDDMEKGIWFL